MDSFRRCFLRVVAVTVVIIVDTPEDTGARLPTSLIFSLLVLGSLCLSDREITVAIAVITTASNNTTQININIVHKRNSNIISHIHSTFGDTGQI